MTAQAMLRREFITLLGSATAAWPLAARGRLQQFPGAQRGHILKRFSERSRMAAFNVRYGHIAVKLRKQRDSPLILRKGSRGRATRLLPAGECGSERVALHCNNLVRFRLTRCVYRLSRLTLFQRSERLDMRSEHCGG